MNNKQQELYEKLLKKVNEFCLGQAAEDVIAAIDDLVDSYETPKVDLTSKPLQALEKIGNAETKDTSFGTEIKTNLSNEYRIIETALKDYENTKARLDDTQALLCEKAEQLKALEIIKKKVLDMNYFNMIADRCDLTYQEYNLLLEVLK